MAANSKKAGVLAENHPDRLVSERGLAALYRGLLKRSETGHSSTSSIKDLAAAIRERYQLNRAPEVLQAIFYNSSGSTAI